MEDIVAKLEESATKCDNQLKKWFGMLSEIEILLCISPDLKVVELINMTDQLRSENMAIEKQLEEISLLRQEAYTDIETRISRLRELFQEIAGEETLNLNH